MKAKEMIIDFANDIFTIFLIGLCIMFFIIGDRFEAFGQFIKTLLPLIVFGIIFSVKFRSNNNKLRKYRREGNLGTIILHLQHSYIIKDRIILVLLLFSIIFIPYFYNKVDFIDIIQAFIVFLMMGIWHMKMFQVKDEWSELVRITKFDRIVDNFIVFLLPIVIFIIPIVVKKIDLASDCMQALIPFFIKYTWHKYLFRRCD